ncbi:MAG: hypothetical protein P1U89_02635 [Verrucomicrobiales bacterium]|nr:hypothetical protein [Verrucomicrobiales bacterium]
MTFSSQSILFNLYARLLIIGVSALLGASQAYAHKVSSASLILYLETEEERTFQVSTQMEVESSGDAALDDEIGPEEAARTFVETQLMVLIDEQEQPHNIKTELINESDEDTPEELQKISVLVTWNGTLPSNGKEISLYLKETSEMSIVIATVKNGIPARRLQVMFAGEYSRGENIEPLVKGNPFDAAEAADAKSATPAAEPVNETVTEPSDTTRYIKTGMAAARQHMFLPVALLLALILLKGSFRALIYPFILFLIAHSIGISLAAGALIPLYPWAIWVPIITLFALSIDNLFSFKFRWWRYVFGIAGGFFLGNTIAQGGVMLMLGGSPIPIGKLAPFLIGFDTILLATALALGILIAIFGRQAYFRLAVVIPLSILCAGLAISQMIQHYPVITSPGS